MAYMVCDRNSGRWLVFAGVTGTTWTRDKVGARVYPNRDHAEVAAKSARWRDYDPEVVPA